MKCLGVKRWKWMSEARFFKEGKVSSVLSSQTLSSQSIIEHINTEIDFVLLKNRQKKKTRGIERTQHRPFLHGGHFSGMFFSKWEV